MKNTKTRRKFIKDSLMLGFGLPLLGNSLMACKSNSKQKNAGSHLKILILGGTSFLGPHQIAYALLRGHKITTFTRGKTKPSIYQDVYKNVEQLIGDRENDLKSLENRQWDVVIDNSGRDAQWTKKSASLLKDQADFYLYISSTGVYYPYLEAGVDENTKVLLKDPIAPANKALKRDDSYGVMKAKSEVETIKAFGQQRSIIVRPTYMIGPADKTDRFIHWPVRLSRGGEIMIPGKLNDPVQYVDVRDVAEWTIRLAEEKRAGTYNAVGPKSAQSMPEFINQAKKAFDVESTFIQVDDYEFLKANQIFYIVPWLLPDEDFYASARINNQKAINAGLTFRDLKDTVKDTYQWWISDALTDTRRNEFELKSNGILQREKSILEKWKKND